MGGWRCFAVLALCICPRDSSSYDISLSTRARQKLVLPEAAVRVQTRRVSGAKRQKLRDWAMAGAQALGGNGTATLTAGASDRVLRALRKARVTRGAASRAALVPEALPPGCAPVLVFVNPKSGGRRGRDLIRAMRDVLHPLQVDFWPSWDGGRAVTAAFRRRRVVARWRDVAAATPCHSILTHDYDRHVSPLTRPPRLSSPPPRAHVDIANTHTCAAIVRCAT